MDLQNRNCSCREWQVTGKPCKHALAWILSNRGIRIQDYVHDYYSVARFKAAYQDRVEPIPDRSQWPIVDLGFKVYPSLLGRGAGRPRVVRIRGSLEKRATQKKVRCKRCGGFGHFAKTCKFPELGEDGEIGQGSSKRYSNYLCVAILLQIIFSYYQSTPVIPLQEEDNCCRWTFPGEEEEDSEED